MPFAPNAEPLEFQYDIPIHILAVDDRPENLIALEGAFQDSDYKLVCANSGHEALRKLGDSDFAAILLDVQMPVLDGYETARHIRQHERAKNTPIIFVSAIDRSETHELKGYVSGAVDFLFKPINTRTMMAKIAVFADLFRAKIEAQRHAELVKQQALKEQEIDLLRRTLQERDDFLSVATHELNTPMTSLSLQMQSFIRFINEGKLQNIEPERLKRMLEIANGQVERLSRLVNDLVEVGRISGGKMQVVREEVDLVATVEAVLEAFKLQIRQLGCKVEFVVHANPVGNWDKTRIEQVFINLLTNALKYGLGKPVFITINQEGNLASLTVQDNGIGIAPEDQGRIFERFERAVSRKNYGGLGLGLFITREIVRLHGGSIQIESRLNEGTKFEVSLPLAK